ncbi:KRAB [Mytilus coruscus]|uniref:KRAB n=1 Tax=Mytilus coruscus TaxID=42192 RepID=A0A6J8E9N8_MYTCO|nr:KRAB [Mytilus coruscus]
MQNTVPKNCTGILKCLFHKICSRTWFGKWFRFLLQHKMDLYTTEITSLIEEQYGDVDQFMNNCLPGYELNRDFNGTDSDKGTEDGPDNDFHGSQEECTRNTNSSNDSGTSSIQVKSEIIDDSSDCSDFEIENSIENHSLSENSDNTVAPFPDNKTGKSMFMYSASSDNEISSVDTTENLLTKHDKSRLKMKFHICKECGKVCRSPWKLMTHVKSHNYRDQYECPECGVCKSSKKEMKNHFRCHANLIARTEKSFERIIEAKMHACSGPRNVNMKAKFIVTKKEDNLELHSKGDNSDTDVSENGGNSKLKKIRRIKKDKNTVSIGNRRVTKRNKSSNLSDQRSNDTMTINTSKRNKKADVIECCKDKNVNTEKNHGEKTLDDVGLMVEVENLLKKNGEINEKNLNSDDQKYLTKQRFKRVKDAKNHPCPGPPEVKELTESEHSKKRRYNKRKNLKSNTSSDKKVKKKSTTGKYSSKTKKSKRKPKSISNIKDTNLYIVNCEKVPAFVNKSKNTEDLDNLADEIQDLSNRTTDIINEDDQVQDFPNFLNEVQDCSNNAFKYNEVQDFNIIENLHRTNFGFDSTEETNTSDILNIVIKTEIIDTNYE